MTTAGLSFPRLSGSLKTKALWMVDICYTVFGDCDTELSQLTLNPLIYVASEVDEYLEKTGSTDPRHRLRYGQVPALSILAPDEFVGLGGIFRLHGQIAQHHHFGERACVVETG